MPKKKIKVFFEDNELISDQNADISKLKIFYDEKNIDLLTVTKVVFWNSSFPTINDTDIVTAAPFSVSLEAGTILDISVLKGHDTSNKIDVELLNDKAAQISFEYLDHKEGGVLQIIHTGNEDSVSVSKKLKGGCIKTVAKKQMFLIRFKIVSLLLVISAVLVTGSIFKFFPRSWYEQKEIESLKDGYATLVSVIFGVLFSGSVLFSAIQESREFVPKNCRKERKLKRKNE